jgi:hypothetical protein
MKIIHKPNKEMQKSQLSDHPQKTVRLPTPFYSSFWGYDSCVFVVKLPRHCFLQLRCPNLSDTSGSVMSSKSKKATEGNIGGCTI